MLMLVLILMLMVMLTLVMMQEVDLEDFVNRPEKISAADISAIAQEAGLQAVRENRYVVLPKDLDKAYKKHVNKHDTEHAFYSM